MESTVKKQQICDLWALPISEIDEKLSTLQLIIGNEQSDVELLEYLLKSDLDISRAVDLHFSHSAPPMQQQKKIEKTSIAELFIISNSNNAVNVQIHNAENTADSDESTCSDLRILKSAENESDRRSNRKRKLFESDEDSDENDEGIPSIKRRKINNPKEEMSEDDDDGDFPSNSNSRNVNHHPGTNENPNTANKCDPNWKKKLIGTFKVTYTEKFKDERSQWRSINDSCFSALECNPRVNIDEMRSLFVRSIIEIEAVLNTSTFKNKKKKKMSKIYEKCMDEIYSNYDCRHLAVKKNKKVISDNTKEIMNYDERYQELLVTLDMDDVNVICKKNLPRTYYRYGNSECFRNKQLCAIKMKLGVEERCTVEVDIFLERKLVSSTGISNVRMPNTFSLFGQSKELSRDVGKLGKILSTYKKNCDVCTEDKLQSLLDFTCKDKYKVTASNTNERYNHGLNICLHDYQLQSLQWMIDEENDSIGFYRHFYKKGYFADQSEFYYSVTFDNLIDSLPVAHGGFLCEEMGLGKTIISLALINCNKPSNMNDYSTKRKLKIQMKESQRKSRVDWSDPENPKQISYNEEFKWYKSAATLIIAPVSLIGQWEKECDERSDGKINHIRYYGSRSKDIKKYVDKDIVFTTYGILGKEDGDNREEHILHSIYWHRVILDESQYIKNAKNKTSKSINDLKAANKWCLTGTPFGRSIYDINNQLRFVGMEERHLNAIDLKKMAKCRYWTLNEEEAQILLNVMQCMVMRHKKAQKFNNKPIVSMPAKEENVIFIDFSAQQKEYYDKLYKTARERFDFYKSTGNIGRGTLSILASLLQARQACSGIMYKQNEFEMILEKAKNKTMKIKSMITSKQNHNLSTHIFEMAKREAFNDEDGECPICFECPCDAPLQTPCRHIFCGECIRTILEDKSECPLCRKHVNINQLKQPMSNSKDNEEEENKNHNHNSSNDEYKCDEGGGEIRFDAKLNRLMIELRRLRESNRNEKALIFTSFSKSLEWICSELKKNGFEYRTLTGSML